MMTGRSERVTLLYSGNLVKNEHHVVLPWKVDVKNKQTNKKPPQKPLCK